MCLQASHHPRKVKELQLVLRALYNTTLEPYHALFRPQISCYLKVHPVDSVPNVLEHALEGHEEVPVFEACLTAKGIEKKKKKGQKAKALHAGSQYTLSTVRHGLNGTVFPCLRSFRAKQESPLPLKGPTIVSEDMHPYQNKSHTQLCLYRLKSIHLSV